MPFFNLEEIKSREKVPGFGVRFVHSVNMTLAYWNVEIDAILP